MRLAILGLNNVNGAWPELLKKGPESTWLKNDGFEIYRDYKCETVSFRDYLINRLLNSRIANHIWKPRKINLEDINCIEINNTLVVQLNENWTTLVPKTLKAIEFALTHWDFDYLIRINSTAYLDLNSIKKTILVSNKPDYLGPILPNKEFVSGWLIILSRNACQLLIKEKIQTKLFDDEFIGQVLKKNGILPFQMEYTEINNLKSLEQFDFNEMNLSPATRIKVFDSKRTRIDWQIMEKLHIKRNMSI